MNCSIISGKRLFIGCRDRRIFVFDKDTLVAQNIIEVVESVHCFCSIKEGSQIAVGMSAGNVIIFSASFEVKIQIEGCFKDLGGIWSITACNNDADLAIGTVGGLFILNIKENML